MYEPLLQNMPAGTEVVVMNLEIEQMTADHVGWYQCSASDGNNRALSRKSKINLLCELNTTRN